MIDGWTTHKLIEMSSSYRRAGFKSVVKKKRNAGFDKKRKSSESSRVVAAMHPEAKFFDYATGAGSITGGTPGIIPISTIALGTDISDRIGRKVRFKSLRVRFSVYQTTVQSLANVRFIAFIDRMGSGAGSPATADVIANVASSETATNFTNRNRFHILIDEYLPGVGNQNDQIGVVDRYVPIKEKDAATFSAGSTNGYGQIYVLLMSDQTITTAAGVGDTRAGFTMWTRVVFYDN